jgi:hypothetical protein
VSSWRQRKVSVSLSSAKARASTTHLVPKASAQFPTTEFLMTPTRNASLSLATPEATPVNKNSRQPLSPHLVLESAECNPRRDGRFPPWGQVSADRPRSARRDCRGSGAREMGPVFVPWGHSFGQSGAVLTHLVLAEVVLL